MSPRYQGWLDRAEQLVRALASHESALEELRARGRPSGDAGSPWTFDAIEDRWWHNQLAKLIGGVKALSDEENGLLSGGFAGEHGWGMKRRLDFSRTIEERSLHGPAAAARWDEALASIRDPSECPWYGRVALSPQLGLLPIGRDPDSGLWEFAHLQTGEPAVRGADGRLALKDETGLVFVLLPGGSFLMGSQKADPTGANHDPASKGEERPVHRVSLSPFFLSKYEMTQGQWQRIAGRNPSQYGPHNYDEEWNAAGEPGSLLHPVEQVSWIACAETCARLGLDLPTEAQWEYGARGGTGTSWWPGDDPSLLSETDNVADGHARRHGGNPTWACEIWDDGHTSHAPIGSYAANPFGLHDVHGNLREWCRDGFDRDVYGKSALEDPLSNPASSPFRVTRGACFGNTAVEARSANRNYDAPESANFLLGLRPARAVAP
jgi:formylglycine-generating enzyme required for sulfatase activity